MLRKSNNSVLPLAAQILKETALLSFSFLLTTVSVQAAELVQKPPSEEEGVDKLDPIIVISDEVDRENATLTTIDSEIIERLQATSVPELLNDTPGVDMNGTARPGGQSLNIWGFGDQEDVRITLDGAQKDFEKYRQGTVFIEPELIKQIHLEKGSFTARNTGAFGGSVKLVTKSASDMLEEGKDTGAFLKYGYATNGQEHTRTAAAYSRSAEMGGEFLAAVTNRSNDKYRTGDGEYLNLSERDLYSGHFKGSLENLDHRIEVSGALSYGNNRAPFAAKRGQIEPSDFLVNSLGYQKALDRLTVDRLVRDQSLAAEYTYVPDNELINLTAQIGWSQTHQQDARILPLSEQGFVSLGLGGNRNELTYQTLTLDLENESGFSVFGLGNTLGYGVQYKYHKRDSWAYYHSGRNSADLNYGHLQPYNVPGGTQQTYSAWADYSIDFGNGWQITPGVRYDYFITEGDPNAAPRYNNPVVNHDYGREIHDGFSASLNAFYRMNETVSLFGDWAYKLRAPLIDELYDVGTTRSSSNQLELERVNAKRIGVLTTFENILQPKDYLKTRFSLFRNDVTHNIHRLYGSANVANYPDPEPNYANLPGYYTQGFEAELYYDSSRFIGSVSLSLQEGKHNGSLIDTGAKDQPVYDIAPAKLVTSLAYKFADDQMILGWKGNFVAAQNEVPDDATGSPYPETDGFGVHDIFYSWKPADGSFEGAELRMTLQNIFDRDYERYLGVFPDKGRNFKISLSHKF